MRSRDNDLSRTSETFFRSLLETAPDAMVIVDDRGRIVIVNSQTERMFGYLRDDLYGELIEILLPEASRTAHVARRTGYIADPHVRPMGRNLEIEGRRKDGSEFPVEISLSPVSTESGSYFSSVIRDVTERKEMERDIIDARRAAERANKANTAFLAAASHDLRQPVQALSLLNGALRRTVDSPDAIEMIESQQLSLDTMTNLLNSLLDISRLDAGAIEPEIEEFPLQWLIDRLSTEFGRQATKKGLEFSAVPTDVLVESDPQLLAEIVQNLVSNAIRYTKKGQVECRCDRSNGDVCIRISDTGIGIAEEQLQNIFIEFHQIKSPGQNNEGFGLGLAIVQRLINLLGHRVEVRSDPGRGSVFSICLPATGVDEQREERMHAAAEVVSHDSGSGTIVLIEDNTSVANALSALLEAEGYRVAVATSAKEAQALVQHLEAAPDLIITDYHLLDGSTGIEAVTEIRALLSVVIPTFIVTGDTSVIAEETKGFTNSVLIRKPVNPDQLLRDAHVAIETGEVPAN